MKRLAVITTHPIQYYGPVFQLLHQRGNIQIRVFYTWGEQCLKKIDPGFGKAVEWDLPLLDGYGYEWVANTASEPGSHHFKGIVNPGIINQLSAFRPDAILVFGWAYQGHLKAMRYYHGKLPVYFRGDSTLLDGTFGLKWHLKKLLLKRVYSLTDHAFFVGKENKRYFKQFGLMESQLSFAPHAVDNERFGIPRTAEAQALRTSLQIPPDAIMILYAGKFEAKKSPLDLLEAFITVQCPGLYLLFAGNGAMEEELKRKARQTENVRFIGFQNQTAMPVTYQACDLFCLPSKGPGETWGLAVNEAMACGKAILVSDKTGCAPDLVKNDYNGYVFETATPDDLVSKLRLLTRSKKLLEAFGKNSAKLIQDWNFIHIARAIESQMINEKI
jgi:glycosyltransferase involved in cell wall biosynthesis